MKLIRMFLCALVAALGWCSPAWAEDVQQEWWCPLNDVEGVRVCGAGMSASWEATISAADASLQAKVIDRGYSSGRDYLKIGKRGPCTLKSATPARYECNYSVITTTVSWITNNVTNTFERDDKQTMTMICGPVLNTVYVPSRNSCIYKADIEPPICIPCLIGNPISPLDGTKRQSEAVMSWGRGHSVVASYNYLRESFADQLSEQTNQSFGRVWFSNLHKYGLETGTPEGAFGQMFSRGAGAFSAFTNATPALEKDPAPVLFGTTGLAYYYFDTTADAVESYQSAGVTPRLFQLLGIAYADGRKLTPTYTSITLDTFPTSVLQSVTDESGRTVKFDYERSIGREHVVRLKSMTDPAGQTYGFSYVRDGMLSSINFPDGTSRKFEYEVGPKPWLITATIDENGDRYGRYEYDLSGRATRTKTGTNGPDWRVEWTSPPVWNQEQTLNLNLGRFFQRYSMPTAVTALIHGPDGYEETMSSTQIAGATLLAGRVYPAGAGSASSATQIDYDTAGNIVRRVDVNGIQTCAEFLAGRHAESVRVEGLANGTTCGTVTATNAALPAGARKVSSLWHPDWRKQVRIAEPNRITTLVYNGQSDPTNGNAVASCAPSTALLPTNKPIVVLCKQVELATTDATGALGFSATAQAGVSARASSWTYDAQGHVLTETDPLGKVTTHEYYVDTTADHWVGDLKSSTNAIGHVTNYLRYNAMGKLLEVVDLNGISTVYTYDLRSRLTSETRMDTTTQYAYWPTGLLKQVTQPDGSTIAYTYDDAHRLVAVADNLGNRIQYTLDQRGNRLNEVVEDPTGTLQRGLARAFDALSRTQQTTGAE